MSENAIPPAFLNMVNGPLCIEAFRLMVSLGAEGEFRSLEASLDQPKLEFTSSDF